MGGAALVVLVCELMGGTTLEAALAVDTLSCKSNFLRRFLENSNIKPMRLLSGKWSTLAIVNVETKFPN